MEYKPYKDERLSCLGMGNMRLPQIGEGMGAPIDPIAAQEIIDYAISHGINYFDTAYVYNNGGSEKFLGQALPKYPRHSYNIATKFNSMSNPDYKAVFSEQLSRLNTDYIDFYLLHALSDNNADDYLNSGCIEYFLEQKQAGRIRYLGFSSHASVQTLERFASCREWDFAQIQLNYLDWTMQDAKGQYEALTKLGIPVVVMEPVRGGRLASLSPVADAMLKAAQPDWSIASWAFRWLMRLDNVQVILSGMSTLGQIVDNVATFDDYKPLTDEQVEILNKACDLFRGEITVPCTSCRYCTDDCPQGIDIPVIMETYNRYKLDNGPMGLFGLQRLEKKPSDCIGCATCEKHCPQGIVISSVMAELTEASARMPGPPGR